MRAKTLIGVLLILFGALALTFKSLRYTTKRDVINVGPIKATVDEEKTFPLSPIVGALALCGGVVLLISSNKSS